MGEKSTCEISGAIRLTPNTDGIGIPVFSHRVDNYLYIAETDENLAIIRFLKFLDVEHYRLDTSFLGLVNRRSYSIGDVTIIPFWASGVAGVVAGDIGLQDFDAEYPDAGKSDGVLRDVRTAVLNVKEGVYAERIVAADFYHFRQEYLDVFVERPTNTKYWVSRFRSAAQRVQANPKFANAEPNRQLRRRVADWLELYFHKGEFRFALSMLEASLPNILNEAEIRFILFLQLTERLVRNFGAKVPNATFLDIAERFFPSGIYHYFTWEKGSGTGVDVSLIEKVRSLDVLDAADLLGFYRQQLAHELDTAELKRLHAVTAVMFGNTDAPKDISERINFLYFSRRADVTKQLGNAVSTISNRSEEPEMWPHLAADALNAVRDLEILQRTFNPDLRFAEPDITRVGLDEYELRYLAEVARLS